MGYKSRFVGPDELVKEAFLELYKNHPLKKITVSLIIEKCSISRGTFYFYYKDINDVYRTCESDFIARTKLNVQEINFSTIRGDYQKQIDLYIDTLEFFKECKDEWQLFLTGSEKDCFRTDLFQDVCRNFSEALAYGKCLEENRFRNIVEFFASGFVNLICSWILDDCKDPCREISTVLAQALFKGLYIK